MHALTPVNATPSRTPVNATSSPNPGGAASSLTPRGLRGCYVHFLDPQTRDFVLSRLERPRGTLARAAETPSGYDLG